jgi:hypothetical protein
MISLQALLPHDFFTRLPWILAPLTTPDDVLDDGLNILEAAIHAVLARRLAAE